MFKLFGKKQTAFVNHQYKNLRISLPSHWAYEFEKDGIEACFDPNSQSTLRLHIIKANQPTGMTDEENKKSLTANQPFLVTVKGLILTKPTHDDAIEDNHKITLITWKLINDANGEKIMAVVTYTILSEEKKSAKEIENFNLIENSLQNAELLTY